MNYYYEIKVADFLHLSSTIYLRSSKRLNIKEVCNLLELEDKNAYPLSSLKIISSSKFFLKNLSWKIPKLNSPDEWDNYNTSVITL